MPEPVNATLYHKAKMMADRKFGSKSSLYKSAYMVHQYVAMGGKYRGKRDPHHGIVAAFQTMNGGRSMSKRKSHKKSRSMSKRKSHTKSRSSKRRSMRKSAW